MKIHNKAKLAFDMLEKEFEAIQEIEQHSLKGGEYTDHTGGQLADYEQYLRNQMNLASLDTSANGKKAYNVYKDSLYQLDILKNSSAKFSLSLETSASSGGGTNYDSSANTYKSSVTLTNNINQNMGIIGHEIYHQLQNLSKDINKDVPSSYTKDDEYEAYKRQMMILGGKAYFNNQAVNEATARNMVNDNYSGKRVAEGFANLEWASPESTGTTFDENPITQGVAGSTGLFSVTQDNNGDWIQNFYYYDPTDPQYMFQWSGNQVPESSGYLGYSTGYKNMTTETYFDVSTGDEAYYISTGGYSTGSESTGNSTGDGSTGDSTGA